MWEIIVTSGGHVTVVPPEINLPGQSNCVTTVSSPGNAHSMLLLSEN